MPALNETVSVLCRTHRALATRTVGDKMPLVWQPEHRDQSFGNLSDGHHKSGAATGGSVAKMGHALDSVDFAPKSLQDYLQENPDSRVS